MTAAALAAAAVRLKRITLRAGALLAGCALAGCFDPGFNCWTQERYDRLARGAPVLAGVRDGAYPGEVVTENPGNWWTDARFTGQPCSTTIETRDGAVYATVSFLDEPVRLEVPMSSRDFYMGRAGPDTMLVVQQTPRGVSATLTEFEPSGELRYGACGRRGGWYRECHPAPDARP